MKATKQSRYEFLQQIVCLLACIVAIFAVTINREGQLFGHKFESGEVPANSVQTERMAGDTLIINTTEIGKHISGYGGPTPLEISIADNKVVKIEALKNNDSPEFFDKARTIFSKYIGLTPQEGVELEVDAVTGATYSSRSIVGNMREALGFASHTEIKSTGGSGLSFKIFAAIIVALMALILPLIYKNKRYRTVQTILNVAVLGLWSGTFVSYAGLIGLLGHGWRGWESLPLCLILISAFIYPVFGKKNYYCGNVCPFGSLQELAGKTRKKKVTMSPGTVKLLSQFRVWLWVVLMFVMLSATWFAWVDYELFTALIFQSASWIVIAVAVMFILLSVFIPRPYCRFICPTGTLMKFSQNNK